MFCSVLSGNKRDTEVGGGGESTQPLHPQNYACGPVVSQLREIPPATPDSHPTPGLLVFPGDTPGQWALSLASSEPGSAKQAPREAHRTPHPQRELAGPKQPVLVLRNCFKEKLKSCEKRLGLQNMTQSLRASVPSEVNQKLLRRSHYIKYKRDIFDVL